MKWKFNWDFLLGVVDGVVNYLLVDLFEFGVKVRILSNDLFGILICEFFVEFWIL